MFGRGSSVNPGMFETHRTMQLLATRDVSAALFAPGWVNETQLTMLSSKQRLNATAETRVARKSLSKVQNELVSLKNQLFDPVLEHLKLSEMLVSSTEHRDMISARPLNLSFSQSCGLFVFVDGYRYRHPVCQPTQPALALTDQQLLTETEYYDLSLYSMLSSGSLLNKTYYSSERSTASGSQLALKEADSSGIKVAISYQNGRCMTPTSESISVFLNS